MTDHLPLVLITGSPATIQELPAGDQLDPLAFGLGSDPVGVDDTQTLTNKTLTSPHVDALFNGTSPSATLKVTGVASAANWLEVTNNVAGQAPRVRVAAGSTDPNVGIQIETKGTGVLSARYGGVPYQVATILGVENLSNKTLTAPAIGASDWANANHTHADAAHGGPLTSAAFGVGSGVARALSVVASNSTAIANSTTLTSFSNSSYTSTLNAMFGAVGAVLKVGFAGKFSNTGTPTLNLKLNIQIGASSNAIWLTGAVTTPGTVTDELFCGTLYLITSAIGASGNIRVSMPVPAAIGSVQFRYQAIDAGFDFVAFGASSMTVSLQAQWGTANALNTITLQSMVIEALN